MDFAQRLRALRQQRGFTQEALAQRAGLKSLQIRRYESGRSQPLLSALAGLANALGCSTDRLILGESDQEPKQPDLRRQLQAVEALPANAQKQISEVLEALIRWHEGR